MIPKKIQKCIKTLYLCCSTKLVSDKYKKRTKNDYLMSKRFYLYKNNRGVCTKVTILGYNLIWI